MAPNVSAIAPTRAIGATYIHLVLLLDKGALAARASARVDGTAKLFEPCGTVDEAMLRSGIGAVTIGASLTRSPRLPDARSESGL
jgi:hypothetical protein